MLRPPVPIARQVFTFDIAGVFEAPTQSAHRLRERFERLGIEESDHWDRRRLRARHERPGYRRSAKKGDELAPPQMIKPHLPLPVRGPHRILLKIASFGQRVHSASGNREYGPSRQMPML
jgi:hypothetical protein